MTGLTEVQSFQRRQDVVDAHDRAARQLAQRGRILDRERIRRP